MYVLMPSLYSINRILPRSPIVRYCPTGAKAYSLAIRWNCVPTGISAPGTARMPKILLVEDNEMNRDMLSRRLLRRGFQVTLAVDGQEGVDLASRESPDIILMDMSLPVLDGWTASKLLKASEATRKIPLIALTAHAMTGDRERALDAGCDDYDTKPIEFPRLVEKIDRLLAARLVS